MFIFVEIFLLPGSGLLAGSVSGTSSEGDGVAWGFVSGAMVSATVVWVLLKSIFSGALRQPAARQATKATTHKRAAFPQGLGIRVTVAS